MRLHPAVRIAVFAVLFRILSAILAFLANVAFPAYQPDQFTMFGRPNAFWDPFVRYDSGWYLGIARTGYDSATAHRGRPRQHRVLPGLPAADAIRRTGVRPRAERLLSRRHSRRLDLIRAGGNRTVLPGPTRPAAPPGRARRRCWRRSFRSPSSSASPTARAPICCSRSCRSTCSGRAGGCSAACAGRSRPRPA